MNTIRRYGSAAEADIARSLLMAAGIDATLADDGVATLGPPFAPWGIRLQVPEEDEERALEVLGESAGADVQAPEMMDGVMEKEVGGEEALEGSGAELTCPNCGTGWRLSEEELRSPVFKCTECGTAVRVNGGQEVENERRGFDWRIFLPRSESKWVFALAMVGYSHLIAIPWGALVHAFVPAYPTESPHYYDAYDWGQTFYRLWHAVIWSPILETAMMSVILELWRNSRKPVAVGAALAVIAPCCLDGSKYWQHGVTVIPGFVLMSAAYVYWRRKSWRDAFMTVVAIHAIYNATLYSTLVKNQVQRDITSLRTTGGVFNIDRSYSYFTDGAGYYMAGRMADAVDGLQKAIALYPGELSYYYYLLSAQRALREYPQAEETARKAIALDESYWKSWEYLTDVLMDEKRYAAAMDAVQKTLIMTPPDNRWEVEDLEKTIAAKMTVTGQ